MRSVVSQGCRGKLSILEVQVTSFSQPWNSRVTAATLAGLVIVSSPDDTARQRKTHRSYSFWPSSVLADRL